MSPMPTTYPSQLMRSQGSTPQSLQFLAFNLLRGYTLQSPPNASGVVSPPPRHLSTFCSIDGAVITRIRHPLLRLQLQELLLLILHLRICKEEDHQSIILIMLSGCHRLSLLPRTRDRISGLGCLRMGVDTISHLVRHCWLLRRVELDRSHPLIIL